MLIPALHFAGNCEDAIALYEKAFGVKVEEIVRDCDYDPINYAESTKIAHARMRIGGQTVFLNDRSEFANKDKSLNGASHLVVMFETPEELLASYEILKTDSTMVDPFVQTAYSALVGNFMDTFGVLWGFMVV